MLIGFNKKEVPRTDEEIKIKEVGEVMFPIKAPELICLIHVTHGESKVKLITRPCLLH